MAKAPTSADAESPSQLTESSLRETPRPVLGLDELRKMDAYWRAANYLSVGQIYLFDNPLLKQQLSRDHLKPRLLGHWGTTPGLKEPEPPAR